MSLTPEEAKEAMLDLITDRHSSKKTKTPIELRTVGLKVCKSCRVAKAFSNDNSYENYVISENQRTRETNYNVVQLVSEFLKWSLAKDCMFYKQVYVCDTCCNTKNLLVNNENHIKKL